METLKEAREDDLRSAGLKMGDIIKIRRVLANQSDREVLTSSLSLSGSSISELEPKNTDMCEAVSSTPKPKELGIRCALVGHRINPACAIDKTDNR